ncbi:hypothetical protein SCLCIDRAFT_1223593 [Scleroderma citrinum Foug A]|uniref:Uncharacterized protein n=1 Tax=Scleroderma citrinum Foug A TaxID=1036808 RepID=A0A0C2ZIR4_9AGAM|nr:hypothetical protein SCLCIDRAFT_1223593 [Scleroderma citrinum Foug A]
MEEKFADWATRHKSSFDVGSWVVNIMIASGATIMRNPQPHVSCRSVCVRALIDHLLGSLWALYSHLPVRHKGVRRSLDAVRRTYITGCPTVGG